jgi:hypothetical protein
VGAEQSTKLNTNYRQVPILTCHKFKCVMYIYLYSLSAFELHVNPDTCTSLSRSDAFYARFLTCLRMLLRLFKDSIYGIKIRDLINSLL